MSTPITGNGTLVTGLGGPAGLGEIEVPRGDDNFAFYDISAVFESGLDFFGDTSFTSMYVNTNGSISFESGISTFSPQTISASTGNRIIAPFWADVDTRVGAPIYVDIDPISDVVTITWQDVGYYNGHTDKLNDFQLQLYDRGGGDFDIVFRYQDIQWTTGDASGGTGGLGGIVARAGFSAGDGENYFELPQSGNQSAILDLESTENTGVPGLWVFEVRDGTVPINNGPVLDLNGEGEGLDVTLSYTENQALTAIAPLALVSDIDSADFNGGILNVGFSANGTAADQLSIQNQGIAAGQIGTSGENVTYGGVVIGTFSPPAIPGGNLVVFFNSAAATPEAVQALTQAILYSNSSDAPSTASRSVSFVVTDGDGGSTTRTATINITAVNDAPALDLNGADNGGTGATLNYAENQAATAIAPLALVSDIDSEDFAGARFSVVITGNGTATDLLSIDDQGTGPGQIGLVTEGESTAVTYAGVVIGQVVGVFTNNLNLNIDLNSAATAEAVTALTRSILYSNESENISTDQRTVMFTLDDGDGSGTVSFATINVTPANDAPVNNVPEPVAFNNQNQAVDIDGISVADADDDILTTTVSVQYGILTVAALTGVIGSGTPSVAITGTAAYVNTVLGGLSYLALNYVGPDTLTVSTADAAGAVDVDEVAITVNYGLEITSGAASLTGTLGPDKITGTSAAQQIRAGAGNDIVDGGGGNDTIWGQDGNDQLSAQGGVDQVIGGLGDDILSLGAGNDTGWGENGNDTINGEGGVDKIMGGAGDDIIVGGDGADIVYGYGVVSGGVTNIEGAGIDGNDTIWLDNYLNAPGGAPGDDKAWSGAGNDEIHGGGGIDQIVAGGGDDELFGDAGNDLLFGDAGNDTFFGGLGNDQLTGGAGNDILNFDDGTDIGWGGTGNDVFVFRPGNARDTVKDYAGAGTSAIDLMVFVGFSAGAAPTLQKLTVSGKTGTQVSVDGTAVAFLEGVQPTALHPTDFSFVSIDDFSLLT